uniref:Uncharacterized protein n=1 Tax=Rangifer tarandus platyrhynchus TaxID=3082113 RepID=A0ACB0F4R9_RANTA|nr:unnamed protein product [Rangifer tarandus platyrhynchus]
MELCAPFREGSARDKKALQGPSGCLGVLQGRTHQGTPSSPSPLAGAYTSGGETGRGRSGYEGEEERRGAKTPEGDGVKKKEKKRKRERAPSHRGPHGQAFLQALSRSEAGAPASRGQAGSFARKPGAAERAPHGGQPRTCARGGGGGRRRPRPLEAAGGTPLPRGQAVAGRRYAGKRLLFSPPRATACCHRSRSRVGTARGPWASPVAPRSSPRPPRRPHPAPTGRAPAAATSGRRGGTRGRSPLPGPGNRSPCPPASARQQPPPTPPQLSLTRSLPDPRCRPLRAPRGTPFHLPPGGERRNFAYLQLRKVANTPRRTGELSLNGGNTPFGEDVCEARGVSSVGIGCVLGRAWAPAQRWAQVGIPPRRPKVRLRRPTSKTASEPPQAHC